MRAWSKLPVRGPKYRGVILTPEDVVLGLSGRLERLEAPVKLPVPCAGTAVPGVSPTQWCFQNVKTRDLERIECPFLGAGDRLYVRETWCLQPGYESDPDVVCFKADDSTYAVKDDGDTERLERLDVKASDIRDPVNDTWRSSMTMPKRLARLHLEVVSTKADVLRFQEGGWDFVWVATVKAAV